MTPKASISRRKADAAVPARHGVIEGSGLVGRSAGADIQLATWVEEFMSLARQLSPDTQETYRRDLERYVLPPFGAYRIGHLPATLA